ncbi:MAG: four-carbon acid sugar kinase family protein, partial [Acidiferrobacterales bacterium]
AIRSAIARLRRDGVRFAIVDAVEDGHLYAIGKAVANLPLVTGGSGVALGLPANFRTKHLLQAHAADALPRVDGLSAVISGSCSVATRRQVEEMCKTRPAFKLDVLALAKGENHLREVLQWAQSKLAEGPLLIYTTDEPDAVSSVQEKLGRERAGLLAESALARVAAELVNMGVRRLVVAGGETSGAVVNAIGITGLRIGPQIDPGVPWTASLDTPPIALALKSGNFGGRDFFLKAFDRLP